MGLFDFIFGKKEMNVTGNTMNEMERINNNANLSNESFKFEITDVFTITGKGTVVTGTVLSGMVKVGDYVMLEGIGKGSVVAGIEMFRKTLDTALAGDNAGLLVRDFNRDELQRGDILYK